MPVSPVAAKPNKQTVLDTMGHEHAGEVLIDTLKSRFFALGLQAGIALNCFVVSVAVMVVSYDPRSGAIYVLSGSYYPLYRALLLISVFGCCHGLNLFVFKRFGVDYRAIYGVGIAFSMHAAPVYISEMSPAAVRGLLIALKEAFIVLGILGGFAAAAIGPAALPAVAAFRVIWAPPLVIAAVVFLGMSCMPPSPRWLMLQARAPHTALAREPARRRRRHDHERAVVRVAEDADDRRDGARLGARARRAHERVEVRRRRRVDRAALPVDHEDLRRLAVRHEDILAFIWRGEKAAERRVLGRRRRWDDPRHRAVCRRKVVALVSSRRELLMVHAAPPPPR